MGKGKPSYEELEAELSRANRLLDALRHGQADAILGGDRVFVLRLRETEKEAARRNAVIEGVKRLFEEALTTETEEEIGFAGLVVAEELSASEFGFIGEAGTDGLLRLIAADYPGSGTSSCANDKNDHRHSTNDIPMQVLCRHVLHRGKSFWTNNPSAYFENTGLPEGRPSVSAFLGVPIIHGGEVFGIIAAANKEGGYGPADQRSLEELAPAVLQVLLYIREKKRHERISERLSLAAAATQLGLWDLDFQSGLMVWNDQMYMMLGRDSEATPLTVEAFFECIHPEDAPRVRKHYEAIIQTGGRFYDEFRVIRDDGEIRWMLGQGRLYLDAEGHPMRMTGINADITFRKTAEAQRSRFLEELETRVRLRTRELLEQDKHLRQVNRELRQEMSKRQALSKRLVEVLENERRELSHAIHDSLAQNLALAKGELAGLRTAWREAIGEKEPEVFERIGSRLSDAIRQSREFSRELRPSVLDQLGLVSALRDLKENMEQIADFEIVLYNKLAEERFAPDVELALYRIAQESLINVMKHARSKQVNASLIRVGDDLRLTIEDQGAGFDTADPHLRPQGLLIMEERARLSGGELHIESSEGKGTVVVAKIPLNRKESLGPATGS